MARKKIMFFTFRPVYQISYIAVFLSHYFLVFQIILYLDVNLKTSNLIFFINFS